jgi:hypothetical protein
MAAVAHWAADWFHGRLFRHQAMAHPVRTAVVCLLQAGATMGLIRALVEGWTGIAYGIVEPVLFGVIFGPFMVLIFRHSEDTHRPDRHEGNVPSA